MSEKALMEIHPDRLHPSIEGWLHEKQGRTGS